MQRTLTSFVLAAAMLAAPSAARAQAEVPALEPVQASLRVVRTETCADQAAVRHKVEEILERPVFVADDLAALVVEVRFRRVPEGWEANLRLSERGEVVGERSLLSAEASCAALDGPASLVIALMVDAHRPRSRLRAPPPPMPVPTTLIEEPAPLWGMRSSASLRGSVGALPGAALGLSVASVVRPPAGIPVQASLSLWPTADSQQDGVGGRFRLWHAGLGVCPGWEGDVVRFAVCSSLQLGQLEGAGIGLSRTREPRHLWVHADATADLGVRWGGPLGVHLSLGLAVPFHRPDFVYSSAEGDIEPVHRPWPVVPLAGIGLEANLSP